MNDGIYKKIIKNIILNGYTISSLVKNGTHQKYIFLHSHMRARSTLTSWILASSKEVSGGEEYHLRYRKKSDLDQLRWIVIRSELKWKPPARLILDNINHSIDKVEDSLFNSYNIFHIFLVRNPFDTISSCIAKFSNKSSTNCLVNYYKERVKTLKILGDKAHRSPNGMLYVESDDLINKTGETLDSISKYLQLKYPLSENYMLRSSNPKSPPKNKQEDFLGQGKIIKKKREYSFNLSEELLIPCWKVYQNTHSYLINLNQRQG